MRPLRLIAHGPQGVTLTDAAAIYIGAVVDETQVIDIRDTVLDPEICARGSKISLPFPCVDYAGHRIEFLYYPAFEHQRQGRLIHLNRMAVAANLMLRTIQSFSEGTSTEETVQKMVLSYQLAAIRMLGGKRGVVNSNMVASRVSHSARAVLVVNADRHPEAIGIPASIMHKLKLKNGDLVFVGREPTIWHGSIEIVRAKSTNRNVIELHPLLFKQLGADCVGNTPVLLRHKVDDLRQPVYDQGMATTTLIETKTRVADLRELAPEAGIFKYDDLQVLKHDGTWVDVQWVQRKLAKKTLDIVTRHGGLLRITPEHRVKSNGFWRKAGSLKVGDRIDLQPKYPIVEHGKGTISTELAWVLGLICADGTVGTYVRKNSGKKGDTRYEFRLSNNDTALLQKARRILQGEFRIPMEIQQYDCERPGSKTRFPTDKHISHLVVSGAEKGQKRDFVLELTRLCCGHKNQKKIPVEVFSTFELSEAWLDGFNAGDGRREPGNATYDLAVGDREILSGIGLLARRIGATITVTPFAGKNAFRVRITDHREGPYWGASRVPDQIIAVEEGPVVPVFDLKTEGEFVAGLFQVHNCDGDTVYVYAVPKDAKCQEEASQQVLGFTQHFAKWPAYLRTEDESDYVDWDNIDEENARRASVTGFSVTPREILAKGDRVQKLCRAMGKDVADECVSIAKGIDEPTLKKYVKDQNEALLHMKVWMGPIGAVSNKLRVFAGMNKELIASASYVSERLQQMLLDTKHHIGRQQGYGVNDVLDILNRRGRFSMLSPVYLEDVVDQMAKCGMNRDAIWPIMAQLWLVYPFQRAIEDCYKSLPTYQLGRMRAYVNEFFETKKMKPCLEKVVALGAKHSTVTLQTLIEKHREYAMGISDICADGYPLMQLMSDRIMADRDKAFGFAKQIFVDGKKDQNGVTRIVIEEALNAAQSR